jgi:hypothetical protein
MRRFLAILAIGFAGPLLAEVGDPQLRTDHPWYPGELAISTFARLAATAAEVYQRETGRVVDNDEDRALASWYWRNLYYAHGQEGAGDYFDQGFENTDWNREYWHGLFAHGMSLCGTTHAQWTAEMQHLLGHCRSRCVGVTGHNSFEVFLRGGAYGDGRWALLDHDVSTVIFAPSGERLLSIAEVVAGDKQLRDNAFQAERQRGWRIAGLYEQDVANLYDEYTASAYLAGYAGPPPMAHLRRGESLRRYVHPGLGDRRSYVFWGPNLNHGGVPGPHRDRSWVNQPEKMFRADRDAGSREGRVRFGNAVYTYRPSFRDGAYREGVVSESDQHVTFEFRTPYVIGASPRSDELWGIYRDGCSGGLVVRGRGPASVRISTDRGSTWHSGTANGDDLDFTDHAKGHQQYQLRFDSGAAALASTELEIITVCQMNAAIIPRLRSGTNQISYLASGKAIVSAGPNRDQAAAHLISGQFERSPSIKLELATPRGQRAIEIHAASHNQSGNPPSAELAFAIDHALPGGDNWTALVSDWKIQRRQPEPPDQWSQSFTYGSAELSTPASSVRVRFGNNGGKSYRRAEAHLVYQVANPTAATVTFAWTEDGGQLRQVSQPVAAGDQPQQWRIETRGEVETQWVEIAVP